MAQIDILMATFRGEAFLTQQIHSLQDQTFRDWRLLIHDDGSDDATTQIIARFAAEDERIQWIEDGMTFHAPGPNFMHLLQFSTAPFAIFCDQDDIWLENKLEVMYRRILQQDNSLPQAVYSNSYVYDPVTDNLDGYATLFHPQHLRDVLFMNSGIQGCAILFNVALRNLCQTPPPVVVMHDHVITLAALACGELTYLDRRLMLYRRHQDVVTGRTDKHLAERVSRFFQKGKTVIDRSHFEAIRSFYETYREKMPEASRNTFEDFFGFSRGNRWQHFWHAWRGKYRLGNHPYLLLIKILLRPIL